MLKIITFSLIILAGCVPVPNKEKNCLSIYYKELNGGTFSVIQAKTPAGFLYSYELFGKYVRNDDGTISLTDGGNLRERVGFAWHTTRVDPEMKQLPIYLHPNCRFCSKGPK